MSLGLDKRIELEMRGRPAAQIQDLNLDNCRASKIEGLTSEFVNLQTLSLINLGLTSLENFPKLGNLKKLELSDNRISGGLNHLTGCVNLAHLSLSGNKIKDFDVLDPLKDLPHLESLDLFNCSVTQVPDYRVQVFNKLQHLIYLDGFDRNDREQDDVDGEDEDEDDDDEDEGDEDDDDDDENEEVGLSYLTKNIDDEDEEEEEDYDPNEEVDDDDAIVEGGDDDEDEDDEGEEGEEEVDPNLEDGDEDEDDDDEDEEGEGEDEEGEEQRGTKRKHEDEEEEEPEQV